MKPKAKESEDLRKRLQETDEKFQTLQKQNEELLASEELTRAILDQSAEVVFVCDQNGRVMRSSHIAHRFFTSKILQQHFDKVCPLTLTSNLPFQRQSFSISSVLTGKIFRALEVAHVRNDGRIFHFLLNARPLLHKQEKVLGCVVILTDITERKQMEEELRKSRDELDNRIQERTKEVREQARVLDSFFKFSMTPFVILDKDFNFIRVNEAYAKACHRDISEFPGHNHFEFYPSDAKEIFEQVVETKVPYQAIARPFTFPDHPEWGTTYWNWTLTPILGGTGEVEYLVFALEDVTERKRAEKAVKEERQRFNDVLEMLPAYLVLLSPDYHVPFANRFFRERFGDSHGKRCFEYLFDRGEPCEICETYTVLKTKTPHQWEWTGPDGRIYDVFDFPFTDTDGSTLILEMGIDISERKQAEQALRESENRLRSLSSQLLTVQESERRSIARELHDGVGQMLTAVKFKVESVLQEIGEGKARANLKSLEDVIPMIREGVEEVRRIQMDLRPSVLDDLGILAALSWLCRNFETTYSHIHIEKKTQIREEEVSTLMKTVIYRISQEALNNVAKHSKADLVRLSLGRSGDRIELRIEDNGKGFDLEEILSPDRLKRGLGLNSMRERAELSGGMFAIESTKRKGTTIRVSWPL
jgi:PAS domain S-box-containing protein